MFCLNFGKEQGVYLNVAVLSTSRNADLSEAIKQTEKRGFFSETLFLVCSKFLLATKVDNIVANFTPYHFIVINSR